MNMKNKKMKAVISNVHSHGGPHPALLLVPLIVAIAVALSLPLPAWSFSRSATASLLGGYHDNVNYFPSGHDDDEGSIFARALIGADFSWDTGNGSKFYVSLVNDDIFYLVEGEASSILFKAAPGFRFKALGGRLHTDISAHLTTNSAFDDSELEDDIRTANVRFTKIGFQGTDPSTAAVPASYFARELRVSSLYDLGGVRLGPALRVANIDYHKAPQENTLTVFTGRAVIPFSARAEASLEAGIADNDSDSSTVSFSGPTLEAAVRARLGGGMALGGGYSYSFREFDEHPLFDREDTQHGFWFSFETSLSAGSSFLFDYRRLTNDSTISGARFEANVLSAGARFALF